jgi:hypothetical protein
VSARFEVFDRLLGQLVGEQQMHRATSGTCSPDGAGKRPFTLTGGRAVAP